VAERIKKMSREMKTRRKRAGEDKGGIILPLTPSLRRRENDGFTTAYFKTFVTDFKGKLIIDYKGRG
jgi:hypothetical protein